MIMVMVPGYFRVQLSWGLGVQTCLYSVNRSRLSTQPWGASSVEADELMKGHILEYEKADLND